MTVIPLTWGALTLPMPSGEAGWTVTRQPIGSSGRMSSAKLRQDIIAIKHGITVHWIDLSESEVADVIAAFVANSSAAALLTLPNGSSYTVLPALEAVTITPLYDAASVPHYALDAAFEEQ